MAVSQSSEALRRPLGVLRIAFGLIGVAALVLGFVGMGEFVRGSPDWGGRPIDLAYYDLQLFVLGADPLQQRGPYPWPLEWARFLAPSVTLYALIETARLLLSVELSRLRARLSKGHVIVCGDTRFADALSRQLQAEGEPVVDIRSRGDDFVTKGEPLRIIGDARDPEVLRAAGAVQARALYACTDSGAENVAIAFAAAGLQRSRSLPLSIHGHVPDPELCATLQATALAQRRDDRLRVTFFNIGQIAARRLFADDPLVPLAGRAPHLVLTDAGPFAAAVLIAAARSWRVNRQDRDRLPVTLAGPGAAEVMTGLSGRYGFLTDVCEVTTHDEDLLALFTGGVCLQPPDRMIICGDDDETGLKTAIAAQRLWPPHPFPIVVRLEGLSAFTDGVRAVRGEGVAPGPDGGLLRIFGLTSSACDPALIRDDLVEQLAQVIHDRYRQGRRRSGDWAVADPSLEPWDRLPPTLQRASRAQAEGIGRTLSRLNWTIAPRVGAEEELALSDDDVDRLARHEHERWCREREGAGWRYGPQRSDERRLHPGLVPWLTLPEPYRHRTRDAVLELSEVLQDAGFRIVRR